MVEFAREAPRELRYFEALQQLPVDSDIALDAAAVNEVAEIFNTPLTGSYNWDYRIQDDRIKKLYELGKALNWNAETDIDWSKSIGNLEDSVRAEMSGFIGYPPYEAMSDDEKRRFHQHADAWTYSQFLHGEQGALLVASQLASCAPSYNAKLYAASQTFDEARHVEVFNKFLQQKFGLMYPVDRALKSILDKILTDPRWDLKFIGMQIVIEGLALSAFNTIKAVAPEHSLLRDILELVVRDEARHVTFGINYLEGFVKSLPEEQREDRAQFAYEACVVSRERLVPSDVFAHFGWDVEEARKVFLEGPVTSQFRNLLFQRVVPNLKRIGLLTDSVRPKFEQLGVLQYEDLADDGDIDWAALGAPLVRQSEA